MAVLADRYGRNFPYLRLSLLEACNFRCSYCLPNGYQTHGKSRWLTHEEIGRLLRGFAAVGLRKLRLKGGAPSLRTDLTEIIAAAATTPGIETVAMTPNRILLRHHLRSDALEQSLLDDGWSLLPRAIDAGPAREYAHPDYLGRIGITAPYSRDFRAGCNRLRVTATGDLRLCWFGEFGIPLRPLLQSDADIGELTSALHSQLGLKKAGHGLHEGNTGITPHLASIGG